MIATDGNPTVASAPPDTRKSADCKRAKIVRAWYSAWLAYPHASRDFRVTECAREAGVSRVLVERMLDDRPIHEVPALDSPAPTVDWQDYDHNRWNLH